MLGLFVVEGGCGFLVQLCLAVLAYVEPELLGCSFATLLETLRTRLAVIQERVGQRGRQKGGLATLGVGLC